MYYLCKILSNQMMCPESRFFPREQAQPAKKDKQSRSQSPRAPQSAVDCQVRPNRLQQSRWSLGKSTQRSNALRARSSWQKLLQEFPKSFALKPKVKAVTEKLRFIRHLCIGNLKIVFHWVSQLELFFHSAIFTTFSYKSLTDFRFQLLQSTRQRKPEVALDFAFDRCEGKCYVHSGETQNPTPFPVFAASYFVRVGSESLWDFCWKKVVKIAF